jgi:hypothetical protein
LSSSTPTPEISDTYPGTSGSTQGERNETTPAINAAIGVGFAIRVYCTFSFGRELSEPGKWIEARIKQVSGSRANVPDGGLWITSGSAVYFPGKVEWKHPPGAVQHPIAMALGVHTGNS